LRIHPDDNVVTVLHDLEPGVAIDVGDGVLPVPVVTREAIPFGHKVAIRPIASGEHVLKYGASIGVAVADIHPGDHVHVHNLRSVRGAAR
jgi:altronate dehydratase small subunit